MSSSVTDGGDAHKGYPNLITLAWMLSDRAWYDSLMHMRLYQPLRGRHCFTFLADHTMRHEAQNIVTWRSRGYLYVTEKGVYAALAPPVTSLSSYQVSERVHFCLAESQRCAQIWIIFT